VVARELTDWQLARELRPWQAAAFDGWCTQGRRGIARVVTGAGKTVLAQRCMLDFAQTMPHGHVVVIVPTLALLDQWYVSLQEDLGVQSSEIAVYSGEGRSGRARRINLMVLNTARTVAPELSAERPTFLIVDECHRAAAPVNAQALGGQHVAALGLSATPEREYDEGLEQVLIPALGPIFFDYGYDAAHRDGVITDFSLVNVAVELTADEEERYAALTRRVAGAMREYKDGKDEGAKLRRALRDRAAVAGSAVMRIPVAVRLADTHRGRRTIIFHERIDAAESIHQLLVDRGHNATLYHSRIGPAVRRDNLRLFRRGVFQVLVSCRALDEGVNVPETEVGIIASSTASTRQRIQRLGRVLRPARGKDRATVYTLYATDIERRRLEKEALSLLAASEVRWQKAALPDA
jgi:superfamily II DNA or RNA helicase